MTPQNAVLMRQLQRQIPEGCPASGYGPACSLCLGDNRVARPGEHLTAWNMGRMHENPSARAVNGLPVCACVIVQLPCRADIAPSARVTRAMRCTLGDAGYTQDQARSVSLDEPPAAGTIVMRSQSRFGGVRRTVTPREAALPRKYV